jgi:hypothetical protein
MAPQHSEDTEDILLNLLGYPRESIAELQAARVIL